MFSKIKDLFFNIIKRIKYKNKYTVSGKGVFLINYIIEKYLNKTNENNYILTYEQTINTIEENLNNRKVFEKYSIKKENQHLFSAIHCLSIIIYTISPQEQKKIFGLINENGQKIIEEIYGGLK